MSEPLDVADAHAAGRTTFMGITLLVGPGALVPRPETELLGYTALEALQRPEVGSPCVMDMCCGAGNLACAIAHHAPRARVWASDLTAECVELSRRNVAHAGLGERVSVHQGDLFGAFAGLGLERTIDVLVCNPPYISDKRLEGDRAHLLALEPREAFAAGPYGLSIHMRVAREGAGFLRPGGVLLFEVGLGQARQVEALLARTKSYEAIRAVQNASGDERVVLAHRIA